MAPIHHHAPSGSIKLSICIPTYNNAHVMGETLDSIISQAGPETEIVISDNGSTDETSSLVERYSSLFPRIRYFRWEKNMGVDVNLLKVVEIATGEYCWFLGDDGIKPGALGRILRELESGQDMYLCNKTCCDFRLKPTSDWPWLADAVGDTVFDFSDRSRLVEYLNQAQGIGAIFAFLSVDIFRRDRWSRIRYDARILSSGFAHVYILLAVVAQGCTLKYIKDSLVLQRSGNDSFPLSTHPVRRFLLDLDAYEFFANSLFPEQDVREAILRVVAREHPWYRLAKVWHLENSRDERKRFEVRVREFGAFNPFVVSLAKMLGRSRFIVPTLLFLKDKLRFRELKAK
jgi:O-antigen biosynthesis alpha-1,3-abequosyltransferase